MKINSLDFKVEPDARVDLRQWPSRIAPVFNSKSEYRTQLDANVQILSALQQLHYASARYALLAIFQGMDSSGKDGIIGHVLSGINPEGCEVFSFKQPSVAELKHDFLWRTTCRLPERGRIGVFNRSYYEEVLIARVHPRILEAQNLPPRSRHAAHFWRDRYRSIVEFENHLQRNGTKILKFFLHLSKKEQAIRFLARIDEPHKNWKFSQADMHERTYWTRYAHAYEQCLSATSTLSTPWYAVPADDKDTARLIVSQIIIEAFKEMKMAFPRTTEQRRRELASIGEQLRRQQ